MKSAAFLWITQCKFLYRFIGSYLGCYAEAFYCVLCSLVWWMEYPGDTPTVVPGLTSWGAVLGSALNMGLCRRKVPRTINFQKTAFGSSSWSISKHSLCNFYFIWWFLYFLFCKLLQYLFSLFILISASPIKILWNNGMEMIRG